MDALATIDIVGLAQRLGVQVGRERNGEAKALCPFHNEATPSFTLYQAKAAARSHYHCFGCQAHGSALDLVRGLTERRSFREAGVWLEENGFLEPGTFTSASGRAPTRQPALERLLELATDDRSPVLLRSFAESRNFDPAILRRADIIVGDLAPIIAQIPADSQLGIDLVEAGMARSASLVLLDQEAGPQPLRSTIRGQRVLIPIRDRGGQLVGLAARAISPSETPKYRLPSGFGRGQHLYGLDVVRDELRGSESPLDLYVVEGVFDALRLRSLGQQAVAILGSQITDVQAALLEELSGDAAGLGRVLRVHLFLDHDPAGLSAAARTLPRLLAASARSTAPYLIDAIVPPGDAGSGDPDTLLRDLTRATADERIRGWARPALDVVAATLSGLAVETVHQAWEALPWVGRFQAAQRIGRVLGGLQESSWRSIQGRLRPDLSTFGEGALRTEPWGSFAEELSALLEGRDLRAEQTLPLPGLPGGEEYPARLIAAVELARESASSREYPVDVAAWDRLLEAAVVFAPMLRTRLERADPPLRPFTAHFLPRASGKPRLKCGPCPEDAALQQYVLGEILRTHNSISYSRAVPAVRWWPSSREQRTTGRGTGANTTVSFAYQVDMEALEGRPDRTRRRDMFRPFIDCWNAYIAFAGRRISRMRGATVHVARLDINRFYDELPRTAIEAKLRTTLHNAMSVSGVTPAGLFQPDATDSSQRAQALTEWLLAHSMGDEAKGYAYFHPVHGRRAFKGANRKGLPQGPTLSAYLANVALFDLDQTMADEVAEMDRSVETGSGYGGLYARYVDDIILAAPSEAQLRALVARVEAQINALGLRLNEKSEVLLPKTKAEAREWLVERRGAGFVEYGDASDAPTPVMDGPTSWVDAPTLDRRAALHLVLDTNLDDPLLTSADQLRDLLRRAAQAADAPHGDFGHIARRLWLRAALEDVAAVGPSADMTPSRLAVLADRFLANWSLVVPTGRFDAAAVAEDDDDKALNDSLEAIAVLDGVERLLMGSPHRNPTLTEEGRRQIKAARDTFVAAVAAGLLTSVLRTTLRGAPGLRTQLLQAQAILEARAANVLRSEGTRPPTRAEEDLPALHGSAALVSTLIGQLAAYDGRGPDQLLGLIDSALQHPDEPDVASRLLNAGLGYVQALGRLDGAGDTGLDRQIGPLDLRADELMNGAIAVDAFAAPDDVRRVLTALKVWLTNRADPREEGVGKAIVAFVLLLRSSAALGTLMSRRQVVSDFLGGGGMQPIPQPGIPNLPGLFFRKDNQICAVLLDEDARSRPAEVLPPQFAWAPASVEHHDLYARFTVDLDDEAVLLSDLRSQPQPSSPTVARLYRAFYDLIRHDVDGESTPLTSAYSLLTTAGIDDAATAADVRLLAWRVRPETIKDLAFPDRGGTLGIERLAQSEGDWLWRLGRAFNDLFGAPYVFEPSPEDEEAFPKGSRIEVALRRKVLAQLSGPRLRNPGFNAALRAGELPHTLRRGLDALAAITAGAGATPAIWLHFLEGRLMAERLRHAPAFAETPGGAAHLLAAVGRRSVLPRDDVDGLTPDFSRHDTRFGHDVNAWDAIAGAVENLAAKSSGANARQLELIGLGVELHALTLGFRDVSLALLARLKIRDRDLVQLASPDLAHWEVGADVVLIRPGFGVQDATRSDFSLDHQIAELFTTLQKVVTHDRRAVVEQEFWRITLLGWVVVVGVLTAALPTRFSRDSDERAARPALLPLAEGSEAPEALAELARRLLTLSAGFLDPEPEWPWGLFQEADIGLATFGREALAKVLVGASLAFGQPRATSRLVTHDVGGPVRVQDHSFGEMQLQPFQYVVSGLLHDARRETEVLISDDGEVLQVWAGLFSGPSQRPLVVSRLTDALAGRVVRPIPELEPSDTGRAGRPESIEGASAPFAFPDAADVSSSVDVAMPIKIVDSDAAPPLAVALPRLAVSSKDSISDLRRLQRDAWRARGDTLSAGEDAQAGRHMARIAFLQIDFAESYEDPAEQGVRHGGGAIEADALVKTTADGANVLLCAEEWRRRRVLNQILEACDAFRVDILVLPEYSMRPETVLWLGRQLQESGSTLSVWAGTFRVPSQFNISVDVHRYVGSHQRIDAPPIPGRKTWSRLQAIAPVIFRDRIQTQQHATPDSEAGLHANVLRDQLFFRQKRYPAIAFHEVFAPVFGQDLRPLLEASRSPWRPESFVFELICSEIFAFNGPMNFTSISTNLANLIVRFGLEASPKVALEVARKQIRDDEKIFSEWVSHDFQRRNWPRRSILIAPCITRRDVDYHALGLTAHLSAGVATIFCNSVVKGYSNGGSCLIGFAGWETKHREAGVIEGPYHGAVPGVFAPQVDFADPLGDDERALVIVDVDPEHPTQANPRPQYRSDPARLVAHLPIIATASDRDIQAGWRNCLPEAPVQNLANRVIDLEQKGRGHTTFSVGGPASTSAARQLNSDAFDVCNDLARLVRASPGLHARAQALKRFAVGVPEVWPPPALVDWIPVDLRSSNFAALQARIEADIDEDALPWIWISPPADGPD
jgi:hypothetical protein